MTRTSWHTFTTSAPVFGQEDTFDPFFDRSCRVCGVPIATAELCAKCAVGNDPFLQSKYSNGRSH